MTVKELINYLQTFDQDLEVICDRYSDLKKITFGEINVIEAEIEQPDQEWIKRYYSWQYKTEFKPITKKYLHFEGN